MHFTPERLRASGGAHSLFLHRRERRYIVGSVGAVGLVGFEAGNLVARHIEQLLLGRTQHRLNIWLSILRDVGVVGCTCRRGVATAAATATAATIDATMPARFYVGGAIA